MNNKKSRMLYKIHLPSFSKTKILIKIKIKYNNINFD